VKKNQPKPNQKLKKGEEKTLRRRYGLIALRRRYGLIALKRRAGFSSLAFLSGGVQRTPRTPRATFSGRGVVCS